MTMSSNDKAAPSEPPADAHRSPSGLCGVCGEGVVAPGEQSGVKPEPAIDFASDTPEDEPFAPCAETCPHVHRVGWARRCVLDGWHEVHRGECGEEACSWATTGVGDPLAMVRDPALLSEHASRLHGDAVAAVGLLAFGDPAKVDRKRAADAACDAIDGLARMAEPRHDPSLVTAPDAGELAPLPARYDDGERRAWIAEALGIEPRLVFLGWSGALGWALNSITIKRNDVPGALPDGIMADEIAALAAAGIVATAKGWVFVKEQGR